MAVVRRLPSRVRPDSRVPSSEPLPPEVRTRRLLLRRQHPDDAALINEAIDSSVDHLQASVAWAASAPFPLPVLTARLAASVADFDAGSEWTYSIFDSPHTRVLGGAALLPADEALRALVGPGTIETGYWLRADATGHGFAAEATAHLAELAFTRLHAQRVAVCHDPTNVASGRVPRRLGFRCIASDAALPGRLAADGSVRPATKVWALEAAARSSLQPWLEAGS